MAQSLPDEQQKTTLRDTVLKAPPAAAVAGIIFSVLLITSLTLIQLGIPRDPLEPGSWLSTNGRSVEIALNLVPFAGIAFLWFIGVVRDRLGGLEDRLFATVFLGSGLLFLAMLFASAAVAGGLILSFESAPSAQAAAQVYTFGRATTYEIMNVYTVKMAGVFMTTTSTLALRTRILPRWMALLGVILALILLFSIGLIEWILFVFPLWVLMISVYFLIVNIRRSQAPRAELVQPATAGE